MMAVSIVVKATVIMAFALVGVGLARKSRAAVRHALLAAAFVALLVLPVASAVAPSVPLVEFPVAAGNVPEIAALPSPADSLRAVASAGAVSGERTKTLWSRVSISELLAAGWAAGAVLSLLPVLIGLWQVRTVRRLGRPWPHGQSVLWHLAANTGVHRRVDVLLHKIIDGPVNCGVVRPAIVFPLDAQTWHEDDLHRAIIHELEHVRRGDWASQCLARAMCACYWFHPLVWVAWRRLVLEAERACDDAVLTHADATAYAEQLVGLAERLSTAPKRPLLAMANRTDLATRVAAVLDSRQQRGRTGRFFLALVSAACALLVVAMSPLRVAIAAAQSPEAAQTFSGSLTDPAGRALPDWSLTLLDVSTQHRVKTRSDQTGHFAFGELLAGEYLLSAEGFEPNDQQRRIALTRGLQLHRDVALQQMSGFLEQTVTVRTSEVPRALPPLPAPLPPVPRTSAPLMGQAELDRCARVSMFCRVTPPVQIARAQPIYPTRQRESGTAGNVVVEGRVGTDGLITELRALPPADSDFASASMEALRRWQFKPVQFDDVPLAMKIRVTTNFVTQ